MHVHAIRDRGADQPAQLGISLVEGDVGAERPAAVKVRAACARDHTGAGPDGEQDAALPT